MHNLHSIPGRQNLGSKVEIMPRKEVLSAKKTGKTIISKIEAS